MVQRTGSHNLIQNTQIALAKLLLAIVGTSIKQSYLALIMKLMRPLDKPS